MIMLNACPSPLGVTFACIAPPIDTHFRGQPAHNINRSQLVPQYSVLPGNKIQRAHGTEVSCLLISQEAKSHTKTTIVVLQFVKPTCTNLAKIRMINKFAPTSLLMKRELNFDSESVLANNL